VRAGARSSRSASPPSQPPRRRPANLTGRAASTITGRPALRGWWTWRCHVNMVRVLVVDDEEMFCRAMTDVVAETDGFVLVGTAAWGVGLGGGGRGHPAGSRTDGCQPAWHPRDRSDSAAAIGRPGPDRAAPLNLRRDRRGLRQLRGPGYITKAAFGPDRLAEAWAAANHGPRPADDRETP
jgi:hypothetical protein